MIDTPNIENQEAGSENPGVETSDLRQRLGRQAVSSAGELHADNYPYDDHDRDAESYGWG